MVGTCYPLLILARLSLTRKRALACLFPELVRQSAQAAALFKTGLGMFWSRWAGCGSWLPLSRNFSVASLFMARSYPSRERALERKKSSTAQAIYATIRVNRLKFTVAQRLHTNRTNNDVAFITSDHPSETGDYTDAPHNCQALSLLAPVSIVLPTNLFELLLYTAQPLLPDRARARGLTLNTSYLSPRGRARSGRRG